MVRMAPLVRNLVAYDAGPMLRPSSGRGPDLGFIDAVRECTST